MEQCYGNIFNLQRLILNQFVALYNDHWLKGLTHLVMNSYLVIQKISKGFSVKFLIISGIMKFNFKVSSIGLNFILHNFIHFECRFLLMFDETFENSFVK